MRLLSTKSVEPDDRIRHVNATNPRDPPLFPTPSLASSGRNVAPGIKYVLGTAWM
jgi:hypothetical protein